MTECKYDLFKYDLNKYDLWLIYIYIYLYIYKYIDVTLYLSLNAKAEKVLETTHYYKRCSSRKLHVACRWNWNKCNISIL